MCDRCKDQLFVTVNVGRRRSGVVKCPTCKPECHSTPDGDCDWKLCPQLRDGEPGGSGRQCPLLPIDRDDNEIFV